MSTPNALPHTPAPTAQESTRRTRTRVVSVPFLRAAGSLFCRLSSLLNRSLFLSLSLSLDSCSSSPNPHTLSAETYWRATLSDARTVIVVRGSGVIRLRTRRRGGMWEGGREGDRDIFEENKFRERIRAMWGVPLRSQRGQGGERSTRREREREREREGERAQGLKCKGFEVCGGCKVLCKVLSFSYMLLLLSLCLSVSLSLFLSLSPMQKLKERQINLTWQHKRFKTPPPLLRKKRKKSNTNRNNFRGLFHTPPPSFLFFLFFPAHPPMCFLPHGKKGTPQTPPEYSDPTQLPSTPPPSFNFLPPPHPPLPSTPPLFSFF